MLWLALAAMTVAAIALVTIPLWRARARVSPGPEHDMEVYRDQLRDVERDLARGVLAAEEAEAARLEVERRLLAADAARTDGRSYHIRWRRASAVALAGAVPAAAFGLYLWIGAPDAPSQPFAQRGPSAPTTGEMAEAQGSAPPLAQAIQQLAARLAQSPDDLDGWTLLGRAYLEQGRFADAGNAFRRAVELAPGNPSLQFMLAESLIFAADGIVTPAASTALKRTLELESGDPGARFYLALADMQAGRTQAAFDGWRALIEDSPPDAPWLAVLRRNVSAAAEELGLDPEKVLPPEPQVAAREPGSPPGPTAADVASAREMPPDAQASMIESMVARLAARLEEEPDDLEGWLRLGRSYYVLGRVEDARQAYQRAAALAPDDPRIATAMKALDDEPAAAPPAAAAAPAGSPGPTPADVAAAREMSPDDRAGMIEGMVARLAARLEEEPDDLEGWLMLGRSYKVLGKLEEARDAYGRAAALAPTDPRVVAARRELEALD